MRSATALSAEYLKTGVMNAMTVRDSSNTRPTARKVSNILFIHMAALGDAVMSSPALRILKITFPDAQLTVLARTHAMEYFRALRYVDRVVPFIDERHVDRRRPWRLLRSSGEIVRLLRDLRSGRFDLTIQWRGQLPDTLMSRLTGARRRVAGVQSIHRRSPLSVERIGFMVTDLVTFDRPSGHLVEAMAAPSLFLFKELQGETLEIPQLSLDYPISPAGREEADRFLRSKKLTDEPIALVSISSKSSFNRWTSEGFAKVADHLHHRHGMRVMLTGLPSDAERESEISSLMMTEPICTTGRLTFAGVCGVLEKGRLLVSLNTGISHIAAALRVPVVLLNGRDGASISPWGVPHRVVTRNQYYPKRHPNPKEWPGLVPMITPVEVEQSVDALIAETNLYHAEKNKNSILQ